MNQYIVKTIYQSICYMHLITILAATQEHTHKSQHESILDDLNWYMARTLCLLTILTDDAMKYKCIWPFACYNKYKLLQFINTSLVISHIFAHQSKRKRKAMKDKLMDSLWCNGQILIGSTYLC